MARTQNSSSLTIRRTAIDISGRLGSLYNGYQDRVITTLNESSDKPLDHFHQIAQCILIKGDTNQHRSLLELIDINDDLRLSLLLNLTSKNGIGTLIDHPDTITEYTRIFRYSYLHRQEEFSNEIQPMRKRLPNSISETNATHIITGINWGIDIIIILQLPSDENSITMIDHTLEKYRAYLSGHRNDFKRTREDIISSEKILNTKIYSNIPAFRQMSTLHNLFHHISRFKIDETKHERLTYTLHPIQLFYHQNPTSKYIYTPLHSATNTRLLQYLFELSASLKILEACFNENLPNLLCEHLKEQFSNAYKQWPVLKRDYLTLIDLFSKLVSEVRSGHSRISTIEKKLKHKTQIDIKRRMDNLTQNVINLHAKGHLISTFAYQQIQYCDVSERGVNKNDNADTLKQKLIIDEYNDRVLCSNDLLNTNNPALLEKLRSNLLGELRKNSKLRLIYADFSYCNYPLHHMMILPSRKDKKTIRQSIPETITLLLLGETGVGKSTFINALMNYLSFQTLDQAQSHQPIIAIPVSSSLPIGDLNQSMNEDFDHPGQSVTQHCKSYTYNLPNKRKLRIIDTPGFGDTRGLDQDDRNMQDIINYIKKFPHLNAICFLLKSNESRLNIFFRSCLTQLFHLLGPDISENIIFCFTNSYSIGNTVPMLKDVLTSLASHQIPFRKKNTFYFDNQSFDYLVARQNKISFNEHDKQEYEQTWTNSVTEAYRLLRYIQKRLIPCPIPDEDEGIKQAKMEIVHLTHPMIEAMRYLLRDIVIRKIDSLKPSNNLQANGVVHGMQNNEDSYQRLPHQPISLDFLQDYQIENSSWSQKQDTMIDQLSVFCHISTEFGYFLMHVAHYRNSDPFLTGLLRLIREENGICEHQNRNYINLQFVDGLRKLTRNYQQRIRMLETNPKPTTLTDICQWITYMNEHPLVSGYVIDSIRTNINNDQKISTL